MTRTIKYFFIGIIFSFCHISLPAQNRNIDSLFTLLKSAKTDTNKVNYLNELSSEFRNIGQYDNCLKYANKALQLAAVISKEPPKEFQNNLDKNQIWLGSQNVNFIFAQKSIAKSYSTIGTAYYVQGNYSEALKNHFTSLKLREDIGDKKGVAHSYSNIGNIYISKGNYDEALKYHLASLQIKEGIKDKQGIANSYNNIANVHNSKGNYAEALKYYFASLKVNEEIGDKEGIAISLGNLGGIYRIQRNYSEALKNHFAALKVYEEIGDKELISTTYNNIGNVYDSKGNYAEALKNHRASLKIKEEIGDKEGITSSLNNIGNIYFYQRNYSEALKSMISSLKIQEEMGYEQNIAHSFINLGAVYTKLNKLQEAQYYFNKGLQLSRETNNKNIIKDSYEGLALLDSIKGNWKEAYQHQKLFIIYKDSIDNEESQKKITELMMTNKFMKQEAETVSKQKKKDALAAAEKQQQKVILILVSFLLLLILVIAVIVVRSLRIAQKQKKIIQEQKLDVERQKEFKEQFLANMSHEIRTPMNAIVGMTNLTLCTSITPKQEQYLTAVKKSSENLLVLINDILDLSKLEAGKMELEKIPFRLDDVIQHVCFSMQFKAEEKGLLLITNIEPGVPPVLIGDPLRLTQILINLIGNAIKFTSKGEIRIIVETEEKTTNSIRFRVTDTGIGIPKDKIETLFEKFSQVDTSTTRKFGGTGLGLSISKTLIELYKGEIEVKSEEGKGSDFSFVIPFEIGSEDNFESENTQNYNYSYLSGIKILVADDNTYNQIVVQDTLESMIKDVTVEVADNGKIAIEKHSSTDFDIILMDIQMPEMSGTEATEYIRTKMQGTKKEIPIIALTASVLEKDIKRFLDAGMNGCVPKPFKPEELLNALAKHYKNENVVVNKTIHVKEKKSNTNEVLNIKIEEKVTNLTFLKDFCEGNETRMKKYIGMYLDGTPETLKKLDEALNIKDYLAISRLAHTIKPHYNYMGMDQAKELAQKIENYAAEKINIGQIPLLIIQLKEVCEKSFEELS